MSTRRGATPGYEELFSMLEEHLRHLGPGFGSGDRWRMGLGMLLDWLERADGDTWQTRWQSTGADDPEFDWQKAAGAHKSWKRHGIMMALQMMMCHRIIRPSYARLCVQHFNKLTDELRTTTDREDFERFLATAETAGTSGYMVQHTLTMLARILIHTGKRMPEVTSPDLLEYSKSVKRFRRSVVGTQTAHQLLSDLGIIQEGGFTGRPRVGQVSIEDMVDSYGPACREVRDVLVAYLKERAASLDYGSVRMLALHLVELFWCDLERHHPGIHSLNLTPDTAAAWKKRVRIKPDGQPRLTLEHLFISVRAFYLDVAQWALERPEVWGAYAFPPPISEADQRSMRKAKDQRRARIHARVRTLRPALPKLVDFVHKRHRDATGLLEAAIACPEGEAFTFQERRYLRIAYERSDRERELGAVGLRIRRLDDPKSSSINCRRHEDDAFWTWAIIDVLRLTGLRLEEMLELTHLSIREYQMADGQVVLLLQISPSKMDTERVMPICPELSHVLASIVSRVKGDLDRVPSIQRYDPHERVLSAALPYLFQRRRASGRVMHSKASVAYLLTRAVSDAGLCDVDGQPLHFTPHDFRRLFATETVNGGLPIHIAAKLLGHLDLNTTRGYVAVYPEEVVRHFQAHIARQRALRPGEEYREPTEAEWAEFEKHFRHRKMALGDCYRPYGTDCPHEHACVRCPMLRMDPEQLPRLLQIEGNTHDLLAEARENGWAGEVQGLEETLVHIGEKKAQVDRIKRLPLVRVGGLPRS